MFDFQEKRKMRSMLYSKVTIGVIFLLAALLSFSVYERFTVEREMKEKMLERERELQALEERARALEAEVEHLSNDRGIEEELRSRFDVAKEGEQVVIIVDDEGSQRDVSASSREETKLPEKKSWIEMLTFW